MPDAVEVAIESALLNRLNALVLSPVVPVAQPFVSFDPPPAASLVGGVTVYGKYLRPTLLPATSVALEIGYNGHNQHYGLFQVDVFYGLGVATGVLGPARIAASVIQWFKRGTSLAKDGFNITITKTPYRMSLVKDDPWVMLPVCIPYLCFARSPT